MTFTPPEDLALAEEHDTTSGEPLDEEEDDMRLMPVHESFKFRVGAVAFDLVSTKYDVAQLASFAMQIYEDILNTKPKTESKGPAGVG